MSLTKHPRAVIVAALILAATAPAAAAARPLSHAGRWITDAQGRVVVLNGANMVPGSHLDPPGEVGLGEDDARFLAAHGLDVVRMGLFYAGVEPEPGRFDERYIDDHVRLQRALARAGIQTLVDFHQDMLGARYQGRGFPDWMLVDDGRPNQPQAGFPGNYFVNPALNRAYDNFWSDAPAADGAGLIAHFERGWRHVAARFRDAPRILGYDIFNEPWPGTPWATCANPFGCPPGGFDQTALTAFTRRVFDALREVDTEHLLFYEPNLQFDVGAATGHGDPGDAAAGFSFHDYCLGAAPGLPTIPDPAELCRTGEQLVFDNAEGHARRTGDALLLSEFSDIGDPAIVARITDLADANMVSWIHWAYFGSGGGGNLVKDPRSPPAGDNVNEMLLRILVRPHPRAVAGTPEGWRYDRDARTFTLGYSTRMPGGADGAGVETEVFVPPLHYAEGYAAEADGARIVSEPGACVLRLRAAPGAERAGVRVRPAAVAGGTRCVPARATVRSRRARGGRVRLRWSARGGDLAVWGFDVEVRRGRRRAMSLRASERTGLTLRAGRRARVRVRAVDAAGNRGPWSAATIR